MTKPKNLTHFISIKVIYGRICLPYIKILPPVKVTSGGLFYKPNLEVLKAIAN